MSRIVIIAALEREVRPLIRRRGWRKTNAVRAVYGTFESEKAVVVCAGIGGAPARKAAEKAIVAIKPAMIVSAGLAGALAASLSVGDIVIPASVVHSGGDSPIDTARAPQLLGYYQDGVLISANGVAGPEGKRLLARQYQAHAADMEAASVAEVARQYGVPFLAIKSVSDEYDFPLPDLDPFIDEDGRFRTRAFAIHTALRPGSWSVVRRLASNSAKASWELCRALRELINSEEIVKPKSMNLSERSR